DSIIDVPGGGPCQLRFWPTENLVCEEREVLPHVVHGIPCFSRSTGPRIWVGSLLTVCLVKRPKDVGEISPRHFRQPTQTIGELLRWRRRYRRVLAHWRRLTPRSRVQVLGDDAGEVSEGGAIRHFGGAPPR